MDYSKLYSTAEALHAHHAVGPTPHERAIHLVHIVNPVDAPAGSALARAQVATYESMRRAAAYSSLFDKDTQVSIVAAPMPEDTGAVPADFIRLPDLTDVSSAQASFNVERRLPLLREIISRGADYARSSDRAADTFIVFTNTDIGLLPHFYTYATWLVRHGHDTAIINRRGVVDSYQVPADMPAMLSDYGYIHPGLDCFIFDAAMADSFADFNSIIGMGFVMRPLLFNLMAYAEKPVILTDAHATFHLGFDEDWRDNRYDDYERHNREACIRTIEELCQRDADVEDRLKRFVVATGEDWWLPDGLLGTRREPKKPPSKARRLRRRIARRLVRLLEAAA